MKSTTQSHSYLSTLLLTFFIICFIPRHCHASPLVNNGQLMLRLADEQLNFVAQSALQELMQLVNTLKQARDRPLAYLQQQHNKLLSLQRFHLQALPTLPPLPALPALHTLPPLNALQSLTSLQNSFPALSGLFGLSTLDLGRAKPLLSYVDQLPPLMLQAKSTVTTGVPVDPDLRATAPEMITSRGFDVEFHQVTTEDCYVLTLHRIVHPNLSENERRRPILLQHGLMGTSADYLMNSGGGHIDDNDSRSLAFYLAKLGYDVWLANSRGSTYSVNHTQFDPNKEKKFWQFSFDEMSKFDLPATIATIQNKTGHDTLGYVGHSQGTLIMFQLLATRPELSKVVQPFVALAPIFRLNHVKTPVKFLANANQLHRYFLKNYDSFLNLKNSRFSSLFIDLFCRDRLDYFCKNVLFMLGGFDPQQLNSTRLPVYLNNFPAGTSTHNILHYGQVLRDRKVLWFNYENAQDNFNCYGSERPPEIDLRNIDSPHITLISSQNDWLSDQEDVNYIRSGLKVKFRDFIVPFREWNHFDFIIGMESDKYVNSLVLSVLQEYDNTKRHPKGGRLLMKSESLLSNGKNSLTAESMEKSTISSTPSSSSSASSSYSASTPRLPVYDESTCNVNAKCYLNH